jgi:hypothetical protein
MDGIPDGNGTTEIELRNQDREVAIFTRAQKR